MKKLLFVLIFLPLGFIYSEDRDLENDYFYFNFQTGYYPPHSYGTSGGEFSPSFVTPNFKPIAATQKEFIPSSWGGVKLITKLGYYKFFPLLDDPNSLLFKRNGISIDSNIGLSPVILLANSTVSFTPIAFLNFYTMVELGLGWSALGFNGIGVHMGDGNYSKTPGFYAEIKMGGRFQFDFNAIFGGDWTHIITVLGTDFFYLANPQANEGQLWTYKADSGKNLNGFSFSPYALLAYSMPKIPLKVIGVLYEGKTYIGKSREESTISNGGWGSDVFTHNLSLVSSFEIIPPLTLGLQFKFATEPHYTEETAGIADISKKVATNRFYFYYDSIGISLTYKF